MKKILTSLAIAAAIVLVLVVGAMIFLNVATMHGRVLVVPDFTNMSIAEAESLAEASQVRIDVVDSLYVKRMEKGHIYRQNPKAGSQVKKGRRILITINAMNAKKVDMPDLIGFSMRQATAELQSRGLVLGNLIYQQDMATDNVLAQRCRGRVVAPGTKVETGTVVDLVVGLALAVTVVVAKIVGCLLPIGAKVLKLDPAVMASPFITTIVDALSLLVYFLFAKSLLGV